MVKSEEGRSTHAVPGKLQAKKEAVLEAIIEKSIQQKQQPVLGKRKSREQELVMSQVSEKQAEQQTEKRRRVSAKSEGLGSNGEKPSGALNQTNYD